MRTDKPEQQSLFGPERLDLNFPDPAPFIPPNSAPEKNTEKPVSVIDIALSSELNGFTSDSTAPEINTISTKIETKYKKCSDVDKSTLAPMLRQYVEIKESYPDFLLLFQVGDFFEVFFEDALTVADALSIRLTSRDKDHDNPIPMCGVPIHAFENYLPKLVSQGFSCVVVEQTEDAAQAKGLVRREITRVLTPGIRFDGEGLDEKKFNYLAALLPDGLEGAVLAFIEISTGNLIVREATSPIDIENLLSRYHPCEMLLPFRDGGSSMASSQQAVMIATEYAKRSSIKVTLRPFSFPSTFDEKCLVGFSMDQEARSSILNSIHTASAPIRNIIQGLLQYVREVSLQATLCLSSFSFGRASTDVVVDSATRRNLELVESSFDGDRKYSVLGVIDRTKTAAGGRLLRDWILSPLADKTAIEDRLDALEELIGQPSGIELVRRVLSEVRDIERLASRIASNRAMPYDFSLLRASLRAVPGISEALGNFKSRLFTDWQQSFDPLDDIRGLLDKAFVDDIPPKWGERDVIRSEYHEELARLRSLRAGSQTLLTQLEQTEKEKTGIATPRVKHNSVFGYFIEVSKGQASRVPESYVRRQTLTNAERFITPELKDLEQEILSAKGRIGELERDLFNSIKSQVSDASVRLQQLARQLAFLDVVYCLAYISIRNAYVRPLITNTSISSIRGGRHPVVEQVVGRPNFIPNDLDLDTSNHRFAVLTGPNMGGKSTYLRQIGIIHVLAQAGCFVPAEFAEIGVAERIFTRIGAGDALAKGESTFMVEMKEAAHILKNASQSSLVLIDEIGRGTATADGLALATAISHFLINRTACRTVFATHFHELTALPAYSESVKCLSVGILETKNTIEFTHRIEHRACEKSYGIHVARLAGVPEEVLCEADSLLSADLATASPEIIPVKEPNGNSLLRKGMESHNHALSESARTVLRIVKNVDPATITPLRALELLFELSAKANEDKEHYPE